MPAGNGLRPGGSSAPPCSCEPPTCWPARGATRSTRRPCWVSRRPRFQAEIDAACELVDFWRFNVAYVQRLMSEQPISSPGVWNQVEYRPLEGFVFAVTPFNFTAIAGNLPTAPAMMGNTVLLKPASSAVLSAHYLIKLLEAAGMPPGVVNLVLGSGREIGDPVLAHPDFAGIHFTGSTAVFQGMWRTIGAEHRPVPQLPANRGRDRRQGLHLRSPVGRSRRGGHRDHARRLRVPGTEVLGLLARVRALQPVARDPGAAGREVAEIAVGDVRDFRNFMGAVIDASAFATHEAAIEAARTRRTPTSWWAARSTTRAGILCARR